jgi:TPR repeat protein/DNA polymerase III delta prime subunit
MNRRHDCEWGVFPKRVLNLSFDELRTTLRIAIRQPAIPKTENSLTAYYSNYIPFILEEARAIISSGLEKVDLYLVANGQRNRRRSPNAQNLSEVKPFDLVLQLNATLPATQGNPLILNFKGAVPARIEHGKSMIVLLLKIPATNVSSEKQWLALATENFEGNETKAKIVTTSDDYNYFRTHFKRKAKWKAHYLGSVISEQRMFNHCLMKIENSCMKRIIHARISHPNVQPNAYVNSAISNLNKSQKEALYAFFNAPDGSVLLLQGPPGTGKTTTLLNLLKCTANQCKRIMVSAHSNKGVLVLALRTNRELPDTRMVVIGVESKVPEELKPIFLNRWYDNIAKSFATYHEFVTRLAEDINSVIDISIQDLLHDFSSNLLVSKGALKKFSLLYYQGLEDDTKSDMKEVCGAYPITLSDLESIQSTINVLLRDSTNQEDWCELLSKQTHLMRKWSNISRSSIERCILDRANIIFSTLITSGRDSLNEMSPIDYLLVDEAAQSVEAATMIPMRFQPQKVLLVGDTQQLPATVISEYLDSKPVGLPDTHYKWSMMWRLIEENNQPSLMLDIQYRMHPQICWWPAEKYYRNKLVTAPEILPMTPLTTNGITSRPYSIYQVSGEEKNPECSHSICNDKEAKFVTQIIRQIRGQNQDKSIGVITPYSAQKFLITEKLRESNLQHELVDVNTVDGFQGDERDVIIISFTRTHVSTFLKEFRRLNVAVTRPKYCLIILANPGLATHDIGSLIDDARLRRVVFSEAELRSILQTGRLSTQPLVSSLQLPERAWAGNPQAQYEYYRQLRSQNLPLSLIWLRKSAEQGHPFAQFELSQLYQTGDRSSMISKNIQLSLKWLEKSAQQDCELAQYDLAKKFISGDFIQMNSHAGIYWFKRAANNNHLEAIICLARCYSSGQHVPRNLDEAVHYYQLAAPLNDIASMFELAQLLEARNVTEEAIVWYRKLASLSQHSAYYPLSQLLGETADGIYYLQRAADDRVVDAQYKLMKLLTHGSSFVEINLCKAVFYAKRLADINHQLGLLALVELLQQHPTMEITDLERKFYYKNAADRNHPASQYYYAILLWETDASVAHQYFKKAVEAGYSDAYYYFAFLEKQNNSEDNSFFYFKKSLECGKHVILSKQECIKYYIKHNISLELCLQLCEELYNADETSFSFVLARFLDTGLAGKSDRQRALGIYSELSSDNHSVAAFYAGVMLSDIDDHFFDLDRAKYFFNLCYKDVNEARLRLACLQMQQNPDISLTEKLLADYCGSFFNAHDDVLDGTSKRLERIIHSLQPVVPYEIDHVVHYTPKIDFYLGKIFEDGLGVPANLMRAFSHYRASAKESYLEGMYRCAYCYEHGIGTKRDWLPAKQLYQQAADQGHNLAKKRLTWQYSVLSSFTEMNDSQLKNKKETCTIS